MTMQPQVKKAGDFSLHTVTTFGHERKVLQCSDSACLLIYLKDQDKIVLVRQQREAMVRLGNPEGQITELVAGRFDRVESVPELMAREASEEAGTKIRPEDIELVNYGFPMALSSGILTELSWLGYVEISDDQIDPSSKLYGLHEEGEVITRISIPVADVPNYVCQGTRVFGMIQWFLRRRLQQQLDQLKRDIDETRII